jgi:dienelactone hydrolase
MAGHPGDALTFPSGGLELRAHVYRPPDHASPAPRGLPVVVVNHGSGLEQDSKPGVARLLADDGYVVFVPYRRGYAGSPGQPRTEAVTAQPGEPGYGAQVAARLLAESDDVLAALRFVRAMPGVDPARTAVLGSSYGGINSILAAGRDPDLRACVSFAAAAMTWPHAPEVRELLQDYVDRARCPFLFLQAENDFDTAPSAVLAERCRARGHPHERHLFARFGATAMEAHQIWIHAPFLWAPVVLPFLARWVSGEGQA